MKVLFLAKSDWANAGFELCKSLRSIGIKAITLVTKHHRFKYPEQGIKIRKPKQVAIHARDSNIIVFMHSVIVPPGVDLKSRRIAVVHSGGKYRGKHIQLNKTFNPIVDVSLCGADLLGLGAKNEKWVIGPANTDYLKVNYGRVSKKIIVGHYPSSPKVKGTESIKRVVRELGGDFIFEHSPRRVSWSDNMARVNRCDIYIERLQPGRASFFGNAALEAAALGKIVITDFDNKKYIKEFGSCGLQVVHTTRELGQRLKWLLSLSDDEILNLKKQTREWVDTVHSYQAVGKRLIKLLTGEL